MGIVVVREVAGVALGYRRDYLAELWVVLAEYVIGELPYRIVSGKLIVRGVAFIDYIVVAPVLAGRGVNLVRIEAAQALGYFERAVIGQQSGQIIALVAARRHAHTD